MLQNTPYSLWSLEKKMKVYLTDLKLYCHTVCYLCGAKDAPLCPELFKCIICKKKMCGSHSYSPTFQGTIFNGSVNICLACIKKYVHMHPNNVGPLNEDSFPPLPVFKRQQ